jgi:hypothetical protein
MVPRPTHDSGEFSSCFGHNRLCANFLWEQQSYENTDTYAPLPIPSGLLTIYISLHQTFAEFMGSLCQLLWRWTKQPPVFTAYLIFRGKAKFRYIYLTTVNCVYSKLCSRQQRWVRATVCMYTYNRTLDPGNLSW